MELKKGSEVVFKIQTLLSSLLRRQGIPHLPIVLVGSSCVGISIATSDLDFITGVPKLKEAYKNKLSKIMEFRGRRPSRSDSSRFLFRIHVNGCDVDLNLMEISDYWLLRKGMQNASDSLTSEEKFEITLKKLQLKKIGRKLEYENYKNEIYRKFCPDFLWIADDVLVQSLASDLKDKGEKIPDWMQVRLRESND